MVRGCSLLRGGQITVNGNLCSTPHPHPPTPVLYPLGELPTSLYPSFLFSVGVFYLGEFSTSLYPHSLSSWVIILTASIPVFYPLGKFFISLYPRSPSSG
jgi:hypothetical protein